MHIQLTVLDAAAGQPVFGSSESFYYRQLTLFGTMTKFSPDLKKFTSLRTIALNYTIDTTGLSAFPGNLAGVPEAAALSAT
jgi:hypothetical protein